MNRIPIFSRIPLRVQSGLFNSLPLIAVLLSAVFAFFSNRQREKTEISMSRHFELVENLMDLQTALAGAEANSRAKLLTDDGEFSRLYAGEVAMIPRKLERIRTIMQSIPKPGRRTEKLAALDQIQGVISGLTASFDTLLAERLHFGSNAAATAQILRNQPALEQAWKLLETLRTDEQRLLGKRMENVRTDRQRDYIFILLSVTAGLVSRAIAMYYFHRRVVRRVRQLTENARRLRDGSSLIHEPSNHMDDIGELERELAQIGAVISERKGNH